MQLLISYLHLLILEKLKENEPFAGLAFKIANDPFVGSITFLRLYSGRLEAGTAVLTAVTMKAIEYFKAKRKQSQAELEQAKQELIDGINQYNAEHENDTEVGLEVPDDKTETDRKKNDDE